MAIDHGFATTIHKSQGATVDKSFVLASRSMDRHLTYVAMTRHRLDTKIYLNHAVQHRLMSAKPAYQRHRGCNQLPNYLR